MHTEHSILLQICEPQSPTVFRIDWSISVSGTIFVVAVLQGWNQVPCWERYFPECPRCVHLIRLHYLPPHLCWLWLSVMHLWSSFWFHIILRVEDDGKLLAPIRPSLRQLSPGASSNWHSSVPAFPVCGNHLSTLLLATITFVCADLYFMLCLYHQRSSVSTLNSTHKFRISRETGFLR